ncbi:Importin-beta N-terminal domain [Fragilaria crotonensis]|nr:Importin-beta N-terminal domain [Fragilaria crotonensis]
MDLTQTLLAAGSADRNAEAALTEYQNRNYPEFVNAMALELATEGKDVRARQLAGLYLKNLLYAQSESVQIQKHEAWKALADDARRGVKESLLKAMRSPEAVARQAAAQAAAEVATVEVPYGVWPEFLPSMLENVTAEAHSEGTKVASLTCLGYTCERMAFLDNLPEIAPTTTDAMLTTIVDGIQKTRPENVRLAATTALRNSLLFTHRNMERKEERDTIMSNICEATISSDQRVRKEAFACIHTVAFHYYEKLAEYMMTIFELTTKAIQNDEEQVATEAIEFWNVISEIEEEMLADESDGIPGRQCQKYAFQAIGPLVPLLLEAMTKQEDDGDLDMDQFSLSIAAGVCLQSLAQAVGDHITGAVLPFVQKNIQNENWHFREAATMAFAAILEGVTVDSIGAVVHQSIPVLMGALNDPVHCVKDTTLYAISKICELHSRAIPGDVLPTLINGLISKLSFAEPPQVSKQACNALHKLGCAFDGDLTGETTGTNQLSPFMPNLLQQLMACADRQDADESTLRVAAFEAINVFIQNAAPDCHPLLLQVFPAIIERLSVSFGLPLDKESKDADNTMQNVLRVLQAKSSSAQCEALLAIAAVAFVLGEAFEKYMSALQPFLVAGLRTFSAPEVCKASVGLVGDISRALEGKIHPFTNDIMDALVDSLKDADLDRGVKPQVLSCFGEIAMALNGAFEPYLQHSLMLLMQAAAMDVPLDDDEMIDYMNELRESVLDAYTGIITGMHDGGKLNLLVSYLPAILAFLQKVASDPNKDEAV